MTEPEAATTMTTTTTEEDALPPQEIFRIELHAWIETQQTSHGVRHDDYAQYQGYCTRRLSRLSHLPEAKKHLVCSSRFATAKPTTNDNNNQNPASPSKAPKPRASKHAYCSRQHDTLNAARVPHENVLWYLLVLSERAWAHAQRCQKQPHGRRQRVLGKLRKAKGWASLLLEKARACTDPTTVQECEAYASWMAANYALEKLDYQTASQEYARAMTLCHGLSQTGVDSEEGDDAKNLERQDLFLTRADTVLRPLFRYCQYELKQAGEPLMEEPRLAASHQGNNSNDDDDEIAVVFRGRELVLESKELRVLLLKLQSLQQETAPEENDRAAEEEAKENDTDDTVFLNTLSVLDDALEVVQGILASLGAAQAGPAVQAKREQNLLWKGYLQSRKTQKVMDHTAGLLRGISGHAEKVHVYDALLQHAESLLRLPGPSDAGGEEEEEDEFALQVQANLLRLRALKTYHMAWYYFKQPKNYGAAWALLEQSTKLAKRAAEEIAACDEDMPHADEYLEELERLPLESAKAAVRAAWCLQGGGSSSKGRRSDTNRPLWLRYEENDAGMVLAGEVMPIPIPCKPVFYDLAYDHALDPSEGLDVVEAYLDEHTVREEPEAAPSAGSSSGGLLGWFTGSN